MNELIVMLIIILGFIVIICSIAALMNLASTNRLKKSINSKTSNKNINTLNGLANKTVKLSTGNSLLDSAFDSLTELVDKYGKLVCENQGKNLKEKIDQKIRDTREPIFVMIVGAGNAGKSSLTNALFGYDLAKVKAVPYTWKIDIFANSDKEYAKVIYDNNGHYEEKECSFAGARDIVEREDLQRRDSVRSGNTENWKSSLKAIWWYVKNPTGSKSYCFVDTPGIDQLRVDSAAKVYNIFGSGGINMTKEDSFDYYYYRSNLVLWCIDSSTIEAKDNLDKLKEYKDDGKTIIGILTKIDNNDKYQDRERIISYAKQVYSGYIDTFYVSGCRDEYTKNQTIPDILAAINRYVSANENTIKTQDAKDFIANTYYDIARDMKTICDMREVNYRNCSKIISQTEIITSNYKERILEFAAEEARNAVKYVTDSLNNLYSSDNETFSNNVNNALSYYCKNYINLSAFNQLCASEIEEAMKKLKWKTVTIGSQTSSDYKIQAVSTQSDYARFSFNVSISTAQQEENAFKIGVGASIIGAIALGPIGIAAGLIGFLAGPSKQDVINEMTKIVKGKQDEIQNSIYNNMNGSLWSIQKRYENQLRQQYDNINQQMYASAMPTIADDREKISLYKDKCDIRMLQARSVSNDYVRR